ncbi:MAG: discoidin domain-containing protein, partial [Muribaculaceae bacterium]|nr:discoidin domain-containing protein [Muribaculaceae bacterium]
LNVAKPTAHREDGETLDLTGNTAILRGTFEPGNGWQEVKFGSPAEGRYLCFEALNSIDGKDVASIAEFYVMDEDGNRLPREPWKVYYADSEDTGHNRGADKVFDLQESTYWSTRNGEPYPHYMVIDLGSIEKISGIQYLPRMESDVPGGIKDFKIYLSDTPMKK